MSTKTLPSAPSAQSLCPFCDRPLVAAKRCRVCGTFVAQTTLLQEGMSIEVVESRREESVYRGGLEPVVHLYLLAGAPIARRRGTELELGGLTIALDTWSVVTAAEEGPWHIIAGRRDTGGWEVLHLSTTPERVAVVAHAMSAVGASLARAPIPPLERLLAPHRVACGQCAGWIDVPIAFLGGPLTCPSCQRDTEYDGPNGKVIEEVPASMVVQHTHTSLWSFTLAYAMTNFAASLLQSAEGARDLAAMLAVGSAILLVAVVYLSDVDPLRRAPSPAGSSVDPLRIFQLFCIAFGSFVVAFSAESSGPLSSLMISALVAASVLWRAGLQTDVVIRPGTVRTPSGKAEVERVALRTNVTVPSKGPPVVEARIELDLVGQSPPREFGRSRDVRAARRMARDYVLALRGTRPLLRTWQELEADAYAVSWTVKPELSNPIDRAPVVDEEEEEAERAARARHSR